MKKNNANILNAIEDKTYDFYIRKMDEDEFVFAMYEDDENAFKKINEDDEILADLYNIFG